MRYTVTVVHSELRSLFHVADASAPTEHQPCVVATCDRAEEATALSTLLSELVKDPEPLRVVTHDTDCPGLSVNRDVLGSFHICCMPAAEAFARAARFSLHDAPGSPTRPLCRDCATIGIPGALCAKHAAADTVIEALEKAVNFNWYPHDLSDPHCDIDGCDICALISTLHQALSVAQRPPVN